MKRKGYILIFDRDDELDYKEIHNKLTSMPEITNWWHYIKSSYILISSITDATELNELILPLFPEHKIMLLVEVNLKNKNGKLTQKAWDWLKKNQVRT